MTATTTTLSEPTIEYGADALIVCDNLVRIYQVENIEVQALQGLDLLVNKGEMVAIVGQSGSGKSTLLNVLSGLDVPTAGAARVHDWDLLRMSHADRLTYRREVVGFVWQQTGRNLLPYLTAKENVVLPMAFAGMGGRKRNARAMELLGAMGMGDKANRRPGQLSGGEQQRVAIAVALANSPEVLFADEPTGELDSATGDDVFAALRSANSELGATVVIVTHDSTVSTQVQRTVAIRDGRTSSEVVRRTQMNAEGVTEVIAEEYAVLDRAGRMQLPKEYRKNLGMRDRVRLELEDDHVGVWADGVPRKPKPAPEAAAPAPVQQPPVAAPAPAPAPAQPTQPAPQSAPQQGLEPPAGPPVGPPANFAPPAQSAPPVPAPQQQPPVAPQQAQQPPAAPQQAQQPPAAPQQAPVAEPTHAAFLPPKQPPAASPAAPAADAPRRGVSFQQAPASAPPEEQARAARAHHPLSPYIDGDQDPTPAPEDTSAYQPKTLPRRGSGPADGDKGTGAGQ